MKKIIDLLFVRKKIVVLLFFLVFIYGVYSYLVIPKQEMPDLDTPFMTISVTAPSVSAIDMEKEIVDDIEKVVSTFDEVTSINSTIYDSFAFLVITYSYSTSNPASLSEDIFKKVNELSLSDNVTDITYSSNFDDPDIIYAIHADGLSLTNIYNEARAFKNELILIDEVKDVKINRVSNEEVVVILDNDKLLLYGLTITDVYQIIYANSINIPLGSLTTSEGVITITGNTLITSIDELEEMIIIPEIPSIMDAITLSDISVITVENSVDKTFLFNDEPCVFVSVYFNDGLDFTKMGPKITAVKTDYIATSNNEISISEMMFLPDFVDTQIDNVFFSLLLAIGVVLLVVLIGIGFKNSVLIIITIPLIIFGSIGILYLSNFELHKMTIVGLIIAIGILVDNSIVITESIKRNMDYGTDKTSAAKKAITDNFIPVLSSTLTTIAAFIVIVFLPGFLGTIVASMPLTVIIAISLSFIVSMTLSPILATLFTIRNKEKKRSITVHEKNIKKMIGFTLKFSYIWIILSVLFLGLTSYFALTKLPLDLYPNDERSVLYIDFESEALNNIEETNRISEEIKSHFVDHPDVINYAESIGGNLPAFHFSTALIKEVPHQGRIYINLDVSEKELLAYQKELETKLHEITGAIIKVNTLELSPPVPDLRVTLKSEDITKLDSLSHEMYDEISMLDSVETYTITNNLKAPKLELSYDYQALSQSYLTKLEVASFITYNLNGYDLEIYEHNDEFINVNINNNIASIEDLLSLVIYSETLDSYVPLASLVSVTMTNDYVVLNREDNQNASYIDLYYTDESTLAKLTKDVEEVVSSYDLEHTVIEYTGENSMFEEISEDLIRASIIAIILIYIIMFIQFNNFVKPLIVYVTIPLSFAGSFLFLLLFNQPITATSLIGMVSLIGVTVNTGILLVEYITRSHKEGKSVKDACIDSVYLRFRPIMLTSLTTILGIIPLFIKGGNFFRPLAITFMGGMISSTLLTIFVVPSVYYIIYKKKVIQR